MVGQTSLPDARKVSDTCLLTKYINCVFNVDRRGKNVDFFFQTAVLLEQIKTVIAYDFGSLQHNRGGRIDAHGRKFRLDQRRYSQMWSFKS